MHFIVTIFLFQTFFADVYVELRQSEVGTEAQPLFC